MICILLILFMKNTSFPFFVVVVVGTQGNLQGSFQKRTNMTGQGSVMKRVGQGQNQGQVGPKQLSIDQKRLNAIKALQEARKTIAQLDQQAARQNSFNARRGLPVQVSVGAMDTVCACVCVCVCRCVCVCVCVCVCMR